MAGDITYHVSNEQLRAVTFRVVSHASCWWYRKLCSVIFPPFSNGVHAVITCSWACCAAVTRRPKWKILLLMVLRPGR